MGGRGILSGLRVPGVRGKEITERKKKPHYAGSFWSRFLRGSEFSFGEE